MSEPAVQCPRCGADRPRAANTCVRCRGVLPSNFSNYVVTARGEITLIAANLTALLDEIAAP